MFFDNLKEITLDFSCFDLIIIQSNTKYYLNLFIFKNKNFAKNKRKQKTINIMIVYRVIPCNT